MSAETKFYIERYPDGTTLRMDTVFNALKELLPGRWQITITKYKKKRSLSQNAYYHGAIIPAVKQGLIDMGFEAHLLNNEAVHELLKGKFLKKDIANDEGQFIAITQSTTELSTTDFITYIEEIQKWASEFLNIYIADPGEQTTIF